MIPSNISSAGERPSRALPWPAACVALLAGALAASGVDWSVAVRTAELKDAPDGFSRGVKALEHGDDFEGVQEGDWVRVKDGPVQGYVHRTSLAAEGEELKSPFLSFRIDGTFYPEDVQAADAAVNEWVANPVVRDTGRAPSAWALEEFRATGGLKGVK